MRNDLSEPTATVTPKEFKEVPLTPTANRQTQLDPSHIDDSTEDRVMHPNNDVIALTQSPAPNRWNNLIPVIKYFSIGIGVALLVVLSGGAGAAVAGPTAGAHVAGAFAGSSVGVAVSSGISKLTGHGIFFNRQPQVRPDYPPADVATPLLQTALPPSKDEAIPRLRL